MQKILEKRPRDARLFDIVFADLLAPGDTVASVTSVTDATGSLTFGTPVVNTQQVSYDDGTTAPTGTVVQVRIGGGTPVPGSVNGLYLVSCVVVTTNGDTIEGTAQMRVTTGA